MWLRVETVVCRNRVRLRLRLRVRACARAYVSGCRRLHTARASSGPCPPPARFTYFADLCDFSIFISRTFRFLPPPLPPPPPPLLALHLCATPSSPSQLTPFLSPECDVAYSCDDDCSRSVVRRFRNWKSWRSHVIQYPATWKSSLEDDGIGLASFWFWYWWLRNVRTSL